MLRFHSSYRPYRFFLSRINAKKRHRQQTWCLLENEPFSSLGFFPRDSLISSTFCKKIITCDAIRALQRFASTQHRIVY